MGKRKKMVLGGIIVLLLAAGFGGGIPVYSTLQVRSLEARGVWESPQEGMRSMIERDYSRIDKVEIVQAGKEIFSDLWFVEARVWAERRVDGKGFKGSDYDNPGSFFLRVGDGWVFVPEGRFPWVIAFGRWLFEG